MPVAKAQLINTFLGAVSWGQRVAYIPDNSANQPSGARGAAGDRRAREARGFRSRPGCCGLGSKRTVAIYRRWIGGDPATVTPNKFGSLRTVGRVIWATNPSQLVGSRACQDSVNTPPYLMDAVFNGVRKPGRSDSSRPHINIGAFCSDVRTAVEQCTLDSVTRLILIAHSAQGTAAQWVQAGAAASHAFSISPYLLQFSCASESLFSQGRSPAA